METETPKDNTSHSIDDSTFSTQDFFREHLVRTDDNKTAIQGDNLNPLELALLEVEVKRRGEQGATSREKARADRSELELSKVKESVRGIPQRQEIDPALKYSDPDEYIKQSLEAQSHDPYQEVFSTARTQATQEVGQVTLDDMVAQHNVANPTMQITPDMLNMDLPPRLVSDFGEGKVSPQDFLSKAADILYRPRQVMNQELAETPNLSKVGGQTSPTDNGSNEQMAANYASAIF